MGYQTMSRRAAAQKSLPYDAEVEYLQSSGTQYIDTLINPLVSPKAEIEIEFFNKGDYDIIGNIISGSSTFLLNRNSNFGYSRYASTSYNTLANVFPLNAKVKVLFYDEVFVNGVKKTTHNDVYTYSNSQSNIFIFKSSRGKNAHLKYYSCKLWDGNTLVRDFIPVRKGNVGYMYDKVSGQLFSNGGTGNFIFGPDK